MDRTIERLILKRIADYRKSEHWHGPAQHPFDFHASELGETCLRKLYFKRRVPPNWKEKDETLLLFETGNLFHRDIQSLFSRDYTEIPIEMKFNGFRIIGRADIVFNGKIIELKTTSRLPTKPYTRHECQVEVYMRGLKKRIATIVYILKNRYQMLSFEVRRDDIRWDEMKLRIRQVVQSLKDGTIPKATYSYGCRYCPFYDKCKRQRLY